MAKIKATIDAESLNKLLKQFPEALTKQFAQELGAIVTGEMKSLISKGISPIEGRGRFPEYKAAAKAKEVRKTAAKGKAGKVTRTQAKQIESRGYPRNVQGKFPSKKLRPVNLELSGQFIDGLKHRVNGVKERFELQIGFFSDSKGQYGNKKKKSTQLAKLEQGHREGANGQPKRPIIPINKEKFAKKIQLKIRDAFRRAIDQHFKKK